MKQEYIISGIVIIITGFFFFVCIKFINPTHKQDTDIKRPSKNHVQTIKIEKNRLMNIEEFKKNWGPSPIPTELEQLIYFQTNKSAFEFYSRGFGVIVDDKGGLKSWNEDISFLNQLFPFAQANGTGSFYAIWDDGTTKPLNEMPIVVFGDEGGVHIVAQNILQLLHLITFDTEISVEFDDVYFYKDENEYQKSKDLDAFLKWLKNDYNLDPVQDPAVIIASAQKKYKETFDKWFKQYDSTE